MRWSVRRSQVNPISPFGTRRLYHKILAAQRNFSDVAALRETLKAFAK
jgi:hypothetical protein